MSIKDKPKCNQKHFQFNAFNFRDRMRHRHIVKKKKESICDLIRGAHDAWSGWVCVLLVRLYQNRIIVLPERPWTDLKTFEFRQHLFSINARKQEDKIVT
jgi:hypothetical protein